VRLLLYAKGIDVEIVEPPGFHASTQSKGDYLRINPIGRVPTLVLDDGRALPESEVICEYLEDAYPEPSLRPADPWDRARMRLLSPRHFRNHEFAHPDLDVRAVPRSVRQRLEAF